MAVFAVGDLDTIHGELSAHFQTCCLKPNGLWWIEKLTSGKQICELRTRHSTGDPKACHGESLGQKTSEERRPQKKNMCLREMTHSWVWGSSPNILFSQHVKEKRFTGLVTKGVVGHKVHKNLSEPLISDYPTPVFIVQALHASLTCSNIEPCFPDCLLPMHSLKYLELVRWMSIFMSFLPRHTGSTLILPASNPHPQNHAHPVIF